MDQFLLSLDSLAKEEIHGVMRQAQDQSTEVEFRYIRSADPPRNNISQDLFQHQQ